jgi:hypothetical protein
MTRDEAVACWLAAYSPTLTTPEELWSLLEAMKTYTNAAHRAFNPLDGSDAEPEDEMVLLLDDLLERCFVLGYPRDAAGGLMGPALNEAVRFGWVNIERGAGHLRLWEHEMGT